MSDLTHHPDEEFQQALDELNSSVRMVDDEYEILIYRLREAHIKAVSLAREEERERIANFDPTEEQLRSACLSYSHNFGLLDHNEQIVEMWRAKEWLRVWQKEIRHNPLPSKTEE